MQNTFVTINGVYDGTYACKWLDGNGTHYNIIMHNGYEERIEWENVPRDIKECYTYPTALAGYFAGAGGYYAWRGWSPNQQKVDGLGTLSSSKYQEKGVELEVE